MRKLKVLDLFSGIGGFSLGLERTNGFETVGFSEIDPYCVKVLQKHWPHVRQYGDVTTAEFEGPVDLVTGGFPCQDISLAGEGAGLEGERSGLYWHILRTAGLVGFPKLLLENVAALLNRGLSSVLGSMAQIGYDAEWHCIPASHVGAPHQRDRVWIVADARGRRCGKPGEGEIQQPRGAETFRAGENVSDAHEARSQRPIWEKLSELLGKIEAPPRRQFARGIAATRAAWAVEPELGRVAHGIPDRVERIEGLGNSLVPQIPEIIGHAILASEAGE
jgi:DNA (cytosine-5)-methyltransferase 1